MAKEDHLGRDLLRGRGFGAPIPADGRVADGPAFSGTFWVKSCGAAGDRKTHYNGAERSCP